MTIRVLLIDDSPFIRSALTRMLSAEPRIEVVGNARNGAEGVEQCLALAPDVVLLDVEMPVMDGLSALDAIMKQKPTAVIMVSSHTVEGAQVTFEALDRGAVDFFAKSGGSNPFELIGRGKALIELVLTAACARVERPLPCSRRSVNLAGTTDPGVSRILAVGTSTGGPVALTAVIPALPRTFPMPVLVVQHMPPGFTGPLAKRLASISTLMVTEAEHGMPLENATVYVAPGGRHMRVGKDRRIEISDRPEEAIHKPSVNEMMVSCARVFKRGVIGVIMTGMGRDGAIGMGEIKKAGGRTIAEAKSSCVIYGMPKAVVDEGNADMTVPLEEIPERIVLAAMAGRR